MTANDQPPFSNQSDYAVLREFLAQLKRLNPFRQYGLHGIGIARKVTGGQVTDRLALCFYVTHKIPPENLPPDRRIPDHFTFHSLEEDREVRIDTDVIEAAPPRLMPLDPESHLRPVPGGASIASYNGHNGTLGAWVWDNTDDTIVLLSNRHVLGSTVGSTIIQPGTTDGGSYPDDRIGAVKRAAPLIAQAGPEPTPDDCNFADAAVGSADDSDLFDLTVIEIGPAIYTTADAFVGMVVEKTGQTSGHTIGMVTDVDYNTIIDFPDDGPRVMCDLVRIVPTDNTQLWSTFGDSGSVAFGPADEGLKPAIGLNFAGGGVPPNNWGIACKIGNVFAALDLGPLCEGGCAAFVDALYADSAGVAPHQFTLRERQRRRARLFHAGITRDLQARLLTSLRGRSLITLINRHRAELTTLLVKDGDTRRAFAAAFRPLADGTSTTTAVLRHRLDKDDLERFDQFAEVLTRKSSARLRKSLKPMLELRERAKGQTLAEVLEIKLDKG